MTARNGLQDKHESVPDSKVHKIERPHLESKNIRDFLEHCTYDTTVILDLDNTVMECKEELGSDQWFSKLFRYACELHINNKEEAAKLVIALYHAVQEHANMKKVEPEIEMIIKALKSITLPVYGLTARGNPILERTFKQLKDIGINLSCGSSLPKVELTVEGTVNKVFYAQGIIFCNGNDKGKCLKAFFDYVKIFPQNVVMVDDAERHLTSVKSMVDSYGGRFTGLRYGFLDDKVSRLEMEKAHYQLFKLHDKFSKEVQFVVTKLEIAALSRYSLLSQAEVKSMPEPEIVASEVSGLGLTTKK